LPAARRGADGFALIATQFKIPPAIFLHSSVPAVFRKPELLQIPPDTSVANGVVVATGGVVVVLGVQDRRPEVSFVFQDVAVFNRAVFVLPFALEAAVLKFFDCWACDTKYFDL
jgi:hypothetical protein